MLNTPLARGLLCDVNHRKLVCNARGHWLPPWSLVENSCMHIIVAVVVSHLNGVVFAQLGTVHDLSLKPVHGLPEHVPGRNSKQIQDAQ